MAFKFITKALQFFCAVSILNLAQAFVVDPNAHRMSDSTTISSSPSTRSRGVRSSDSNSDNHPFLRTKRDTTIGGFNCTLPNNLPERVEDLKVFLSTSGLSYVGLMPQRESYIPTPTNQPLECPSSPTGSWWPRPEINLRSTCPYVIEELALGPNAFPSYLLQARCLCKNGCVDSDVNRCHETRQAVTIKRVTGCQNGLAVIAEDKVMVTVGCFCAAPLPNTENNNDDHGDVEFTF